MSMKTRWNDNGEDKAVTAPTSLIITGFAPTSDARKVLTPQLRLDQGETDLIVVDLGRGQNRLGASCFAQVYGKVGAVPADLDDAEDLKAFFAVVQGLNADGKLLAYHDRADGGLVRHHHRNGLRRSLRCRHRHGHAGRRRSRFSRRHCSPKKSVRCCRFAATT